MNHIMILKYHATNQEIPFASKEDAEAALAELKPRLGERYGRNEELTHTIVSPFGSHVVVCSKIEAASVVDVNAQNECVMKTQSSYHDSLIDFEARKARAIKTAEREVEPV
jgi:hypothetical protein